MHKIQRICIVIKNTYFMPITFLWENLVKAWSKLVLDTLMLSLYYRSSTFFFFKLHTQTLHVSWFWKTSTKAGTEEAEEQARHAWKDEFMTEEARHKDSQRETCHSIGRILRIVFILWILLRGRTSMKRVEGRKKRQIIILIHIILMEGYPTLSALMTTNTKYIFCCHILI